MADSINNIIMASEERTNPAAIRKNDIGAEESAGLLADIVRNNNIYLRGSAIGKGFRRAARYYLQEVLPEKLIPTNGNATLESVCEEEVAKHDHNDLLEPDLEIPAEESFYVVDIGVVVSQFYQWRKHFPRVYPYYAVKCNPDPVIIQTLATLGANFDCASRQEISLVQDLTKDMPRKPEIIYANPCKARAHIVEAIRRGVTMMTYDNVAEVAKCASVSKKIRLILRIITDDSGAQCRLSSKFGAPRKRWNELLQAAKDHGLEVIGVSFHVGSGCRDASRYDMALRDAKDLVELGINKYGFNMHIVDIGGGFPGETHSLWNPAARDPSPEEGDDVEEEEEPEEEEKDRPYMFFDEIATHVAPVIDEIFPEDSGIQLIAEPGRYLVAASSTLLVNVSVRCNIVDQTKPAPISDEEAALALHTIPREGEAAVVQDLGDTDNINNQSVMKEFVDQLAEYSAMYARQNLAQQEVDVYTDSVDFSDMRSFDASMNLLAMPEGEKPQVYHTAEGMMSVVVTDVIDRVDNDEEAHAATGDVKEEAPAPTEEEVIASGILSLAAAGEAAVAGVVIQSVADNSPMQDDFSYYVNDGVYGAFNNIMFDHATVRPRVLINPTGTQKGRKRSVSVSDQGDGFKALEYEDSSSDEEGDAGHETKARPNLKQLYTSTIFGPTCDSIDVICRSVLLPKLEIGSWMYFNNMGAYTMAAASSFNGFTPTERFYVCSVQPEYFEALIAGPSTVE